MPKALFIKTIFEICSKTSMTISIISARMTLPVQKYIG